MKLVATVLAAFVAVVSAKNPECNPDQECVASGEPCVNDNDCCEDTEGCFGYSFYKKCQPPPACLPEWYVCSSGILCCKGVEGRPNTVCAEPNEEGGTPACQQETRTTKKNTLDNGGNPVATQPPTPAPEEINLTELPPVDGRHVACIVGDPHVLTWDGLRFDCMGHGEYILFKSATTRRQVQARFMQLETRAISSTRAIAIQDQGDTPRVQISSPITDEGYATELLLFQRFTVKLQAFVGEEQIDILEGYEDDQVKITLDMTQVRPTFEITYKKSGFYINVAVGFFRGLVLDNCYHVPDNDDVYGLLGTPDGDTTTDWITRDREQLFRPSGWDLYRQPAFEYCTTNWCIDDEKESIFYYNQLGIDFEDFNMCDLPWNVIFVEEIAKRITPEIDHLCGEDFDCITDAVMSRDTHEEISIQESREFRKQAGATCNGPGGECNADIPCCAGFTCPTEKKFLKVCVPEGEEGETCAAELEPCDSMECCNTDHHCETLPDGDKVCMDIPECQKEHMECSATGDCCSGLSCVGPEGNTRCKELPVEGGEQCMPLGEQCNFGIGCCGGLSCTTSADGEEFRCQDLPTCWDKPWRPCDAEQGWPGCCDNFACLPNEEGRKVCYPMPGGCAGKWNRCNDDIPCCDGDEDGNPLQCLTTDAGEQKCHPIREATRRKRRELREQQQHA